MADNKKFDVVLDVAAPRNRNPRLYPLGRNLRSEISNGRVTTHDVPAELNHLGGVIPGERVQINLKERFVRILDRMTLPENREIDRTLRRLAGTEKYYGARFDRYEDPQDISVSREDWPTWLWHLRRLVDAGKLRVESGTLPDYKEIVKLGPVRRGDNCGVTPLDKDRPYWMVQPDELGLEPVGAA